jgi:hypothetical protein
MDDKEDLNQYSNYLNLSRAKLKSIPKEVLDQKDSLESLDISGNNFNDFYSVLNDLQKLKKLKRLKINIFTQEQAKNIIDLMPNLEYLNDEAINEEINIEQKKEKSVNNNKEKINVKNKSPLKQITDNNFKPVFKKFEEFFKLNLNKKEKFQKIISAFNEKYKQLNIKENKIINEKMIDKEIEKELELCKFISSELRKIKDDMNNNDYKPNSVDKLLNIMIENENIKNKCNEILKEKKKIIKISLKDSDINKNKKSVKSLKNNQSNNLFKEEGKKENKLLSKKYKKENKKYINRSFNKNSEERIKFSNSSFEKFNNRLTFSERKSIIESKLGKESKIFRTKIDLSDFNDDSYSQNLFMRSKTDFNTLNIFEDKNNDMILKEKMNPRIISLKNLLDIINQIYKLRSSRIEKQNQGVYNKGTLEQDFYAYLKSRYGLKNLIIEWSINILSSIQAYYEINGEVYLFALILKNELDEDSIEILNKIKTTMNNILNLIYDYNISKIKDIKQNKEFINENEWKAIGNLLYNDDDQMKNQFINEVDSFINKLIKDKKVIEKIDKKILFEDFVNILIIFNMKLRKKYLYNLFVLFSKEDSKKTGIINLENFKQLIKNSDIIKDEKKIEEVTEKLIEILGQEESGQITFTDVVEILENLNLITEKGKIKFLDKLSNMNL